MPDPVTLGFLCASAFSMAADGTIKGLFGEAAKDAYQALKAQIAKWADSEVNSLERDPQSSARKAVVAEIIDKLSDDEKSVFRPLAEKLLASLKSDPNRGIVIGELEALDASFDSIVVNDGVGLTIDKAKLAGSFKVQNLVVGKPGNS